MESASVGPADDGGPRLRRDAARNRERIVRAARELFASRGLGVGLNEVAHHAGVGVGTVYRRFGDKQTLVDAALEEPLERMRTVAAQAEGAERAWDGLMLLLGEGAALLAANLGLRDVALTPGGATGGGDKGTDGEALPDLHPADAGPRHLAADRAAFAAVGDRLLARARAEGDLRPGVTGEDITVLLWMVTELAEHSADLRPDAYRRYLQLMTDGLREAPDRGPLPDGPDADDVAAISRRWASR